MSESTLSSSHSDPTKFRVALTIVKFIEGVGTQGLCTIPLPTPPNKYRIGILSPTTSITNPKSQSSA
ncbi:hypothetical protein PM082_019249 [Marasmius tenuissimus]|nr:hypothetical protein PM082_019249 [Marasmius tenuissimus]